MGRPLSGYHAYRRPVHVIDLIAMRMLTTVPEADESYWSSQLAQCLASVAKKTARFWRAV